MDDKARIQPDEPMEQLLDRVERGEEVTIVRNGETVAKLIKAESPPRPTKEEADQLIRDMERLRESFSLGDGVTFKDLIHEGHKY